MKYLVLFTLLISSTGCVNNTWQLPDQNHHTYQDPSEPVDYDSPDDMNGFTIIEYTF